MGSGHCCAATNCGHVRFAHRAGGLPPLDTLVAVFLPKDPARKSTLRISHNTGKCLALRATAIHPLRTVIYGKATVSVHSWSRLPVVGSPALRGCGLSQKPSSVALTRKRSLVQIQYGPPAPLP
jgi:hypothetical protein